MSMLQAASEDLARRLRIDASYADGEATITLDGESILVSEDKDFDRLVLWATLALNTGRDLLTAAKISIDDNEQFADGRRATLGVSQGAECVILGRSIEIDHLDSVRLLAEARDFRAELLATKTRFEAELVKARADAAEESEAFDAGHENYLRL